MALFRSSAGRGFRNCFSLAFRSGGCVKAFHIFCMLVHEPTLQFDISAITKLSITVIFIVGVRRVLFACGCSTIVFSTQRQRCRCLCPVTDPHQWTHSLICRMVMRRICVAAVQTYKFWGIQLKGLAKWKMKFHYRQCWWPTWRAPTKTHPMPSGNIETFYFVSCDYRCNETQIQSYPLLILAW